jgi:GNAT superfamily N-acetyltransferase
VNIRSFQPGDEDKQVAVYNEAAGQLPKFKPASLPEVLRRTRARDFDPHSRLYAEEGGEVVGYAAFQKNGRVSYPWCRPGHESAAEPLFQAVMDRMRRQGIGRAFAAYRGDWPAVLDFFGRQQFAQAREMVNFIVNMVDLPTPSVRPSGSVAPLRQADMPALLEMAPNALRVRTANELGQWLLHNPYFPPESLFALRSRDGHTLQAVGILVQNREYARPDQLDPLMPCFRLGAFGTETMTTKRIHGMFSFLARDSSSVMPLGLELIGQAAARLRDEDDMDTLAAQVPSDVPHLLHFYTRNFRRQGSFPVLERVLTS